MPGLVERTSTPGYSDCFVKLLWLVERVDGATFFVVPFLSRKALALFRTIHDTGSLLLGALQFARSYFLLAHSMYF